MGKYIREEIKIGDAKGVGPLLSHLLRILRGTGPLGFMFPIVSLDVTKITHASDYCEIMVRSCFDYYSDNSSDVDVDFEYPNFDCGFGKKVGESLRL